ncbi:rhodanese-related sulfurtransferase [Thiogranum longum]|uniref:Rhodanese-related sulfurtransferase n=1 Tax=Thiogranum longum TaxID=1537524 RepID=A0A4R1HBR3_9GAMM|nr:rhodanese-like domain-containing protein [Thiogranum longum]TCK19434.1 rhodanese-related sulfurtransferase [Thiogranum longum]
MREFSAGELSAYLCNADCKPLLLDVREPWEFDKVSIEGSTLVPMRQIGEHIHMLNSDDEIVVICHHGIRSRVVCRFLESEGFSNVINLSGGIAAWAKDVDCQMPTY